ncbi:MAG: PAS domain S-box protein [Gemmatimonadetes bacterium]|nr:PAS domain S-box protein [Gemmatimonadota bacterium]
MSLPNDSPIADRPRLDVLQLTALLDSPPEQFFDRLTRLATESSGAPIALMTLVTGDRQFFKSSRGLPEPWLSRRGSPLRLSLAKHVVVSRELLIIPDTHEDPNWRDHPAVAELGVRAYAGFPILSPDQYVLGAFSVMDRKAREWTPSEVRILDDLAAIATGEIHRRLRLRLGEQGDLSDMLDHFRNLLEHSLAGVYLIQGDRFLYVNPKLAQIFGYEPEELLSGTRPADLAVKEDENKVAENLRRRLAGEVEGIHYTFRGRRKDGREIDLEVLGSGTEIDGKPAVIGMLLDITSRKRSEEELREREEHFRSLLANAWDGMHEVDAAGRIRYVSPAAERMLGYPTGHMVGRAIKELIHPEDAPRTMRLLADTFRSAGSEHSITIRIRHQDGSWRDVQVQMRLMGADAAEPIAILNTRDVTEALRTERALRESEERYRLVARATNSAIREWDIGSGHCIWDDSSNLLLRYTEDEIGTTIDWWYERIHSEDREHVVTSIQAALDGVGESWSEEYRFLRGDGGYATVLDCCHISRNEQGVPFRVIGSLMDVTERTRNEESQRFLARASTLLGEQLDLDPTLAALARLTVPTLADYCLIDLVEYRGSDGTLRRVASAHVDPTREVVLLRDEHHALSDDPDRHPVVRAVLTKEPVLVTECTPAVLKAISHDEEHHQQLREMGLCSYMMVPLVARGRALGVITLASSHSARRFWPRDLLVAENLANRAALAIEHAQLFREAQDAIRAREEVLGVVSHDLRNPLNVVRLSSQLMLEAAAGERRSANVQALERILRASSQMEEMIEDLLDMSSIEAGRFSISRRPFAVEELIREACDLFQPLAESKSIRLKSSLSDELPEVSIDVHQILRVFSNLVGNAIKFTPEGGEILIGASVRGSEVLLTVQDNGIGIEKEQIAHVFDRYWQAADGDRRGAGLGLAIARGIVEAHGGRIGIQSGENGGATVHFSIPTGS